MNLLINNKKVKMKNIKISLLGVLATLLILTTSCNKELEQIADPVVAPKSGLTLDQVLQNNPNYSFYYALVQRGNQLSLINDSTHSYTMFVPDNVGMVKFISAVAGFNIPYPGTPDQLILGIINTQIDPLQAAALVQYNTIPQEIKSTNISNYFPNFSYPSALNPLPSVSPLLRLNVFPTIINGAWLNNIPILYMDDMAYNGVIHQTATLAVPGQRTLWDRINTDTGLTYLKAAVERADSGAAPSASLKSYLNNEAPNYTVFSPLTIFAPTNNAFKATLTGAIAQNLISNGMDPQTALQTGALLASSPNVFSNPALYPVLTAQTVKGILAYHVLGKKAYTNNFATTPRQYPTLVTSLLPNQPKLTIKAKFSTTTPFVDSLFVKDVYNNSPAANVIINTSPLLPDPVGTSDQDYLNGVIHKIDRVLLPQ